MRSVKVKICGITCEEDLKTAIAAGADAVGFVVDVPSSPRSLTLEEARKLMRLVPVFVDGVMVIVPESTCSLLKACEYVCPDAVQIHGDAQLDVSVIRKNLAHLKLIKATQMRDSNVLKRVVEDAEPFDALLVDTFVQDRYGGTGMLHDWKKSRLLRQALSSRPLILSGGLKPENVGDAIRVVQPYAVDVSSGVESRPGRKDADKVLRFIKNVKEVYDGF